MAQYCMYNARYMAGVLTRDSDFFIFNSPPVIDLQSLHWHALMRTGELKADFVVTHEQVCVVRCFGLGGGVAAANTTSGL